MPRMKRPATSKGRSLCRTGACSHSTAERRALIGGHPLARWRSLRSAELRIGVRGLLRLPQRKLVIGVADEFEALDQKSRVRGPQFWIGRYAVEGIAQESQNVVVRGRSRDEGRGRRERGLSNLPDARVRSGFSRCKWANVTQSIEARSAAPRATASRHAGRGRQGR